MTLRDDVAACRARFANAGMETLLKALCDAAARHADELPSDRVAVRLRVPGGGAYTLLLENRALSWRAEDSDATDVTIEGAERVLIDLFMKKLTPVKALLFRKIRVSGNLLRLKPLEEFF